MEDTSKTLSCEACGTALRPESTGPCPRCGEKVSRIGVNIGDSLEFHDSVAGVVKDPSLSSKQRDRIRFLSGDDPRRSQGDWVEKERLIDRNSDRYYERVIDKTTGAILHETDERLSDHKRHGSDRGRGAL